MENSIDEVKSLYWDPKSVDVIYTLEVYMYLKIDMDDFDGYESIEDYLEMNGKDLTPANEGEFDVEVHNVEIFDWEDKERN